MIRKYFVVLLLVCLLIISVGCSSEKMNKETTANTTNQSTATAVKFDYSLKENKYTKDDKKFYKSSDWLKARDKCIQRCCGIDLYSYFVLHRIEYGQTVHHIVPLLDNYSLRLSQDNLIYLTESNHRTIHKLYESEYLETVKSLRKILHDFRCRG